MKKVAAIFIIVILGVVGCSNNSSDMAPGDRHRPEMVVDPGSSSY